METDTFFHQLHDKIAKDLNLMPSTIYIIRFNLLGNKLTLSELIDYARERIKLQKKKQSPSIRKLTEWVEVLKVLVRNPEIIKDIIIKTKYDN